MTDDIIENILEDGDSTSTERSYALLRVPEYNTEDDDSYLQLGAKIAPSSTPDTSGAEGWQLDSQDGVWVARAGSDSEYNETSWPTDNGDDLLYFFDGFVDDTRLRADSVASSADSSAPSKADADINTIYFSAATPPNETTPRTGTSSPYSGPYGELDAESRVEVLERMLVEAEAVTYTVSPLETTEAGLYYWDADKKEERTLTLAEWDAWKADETLPEHVQDYDADWEDLRYDYDERPGKKGESVILTEDNQTLDHPMDTAKEDLLNYEGSDSLGSFFAIKKDTDGTFTLIPSDPTTPAKNLAVTAAIPDYIGWRDHTEGHRISTTRGDKIEVIGGNWKLVSLGRGTGEASLEMSGGLLLDGDEAPGGISSVTWQDRPVRYDETDGDLGQGWKQVEQAAGVNHVERFHGSFREEFFGQQRTCIIGSPTTYEDVTEGDNSDFVHEPACNGQAATGAQPPSVPHGGTGTTVEAFDYDTYEKLAPSKWDAGGDEPPDLSKPDVFNATWASRMVEYLEVEGPTTETRRYHSSHRDNIKYLGDASYYCRTEMGPGSRYLETWDLGGGYGFQESFYGAFTQFFFGSSTTLGFANRFELFVGTEQQINLGVTGEFKFGASGSVCVGPKLDLETETLHVFLAKQDTGLADLDAKVTTIETKVGQIKTGMTEAKTVAAEQTSTLAHTMTALCNYL